MPDAVTYTARWVFPVSQPPLAGGTITVEGTTITAVEPHGTRTPDVDLGNVAIIPGLVNCHTHLDLSGARGKIPPTDPDQFTDWLRGVIAYRRARSPDDVQADIRDGLAECMRFGTTLIGDITAGGGSYAAVAESSVRATLFWELIGLDCDRYLAAVETYGKQTHADWDESGEPPAMPPMPLCRWAASPHAPYSVNHREAQQQIAFGNTAIHLAESPGELQLLDDRSGPFVPFLQDLGVWNPTALTLKATEFLRGLNVWSGPRLFVHANYLPPDAAVPPLGAVIYCPRTHAAFGHPRHPFREFQQRGVRVALGTDSLASNPDLDLLAEARFVHSIRPEVPCDELLRMATLTGAEALGWADETGSLEVGRSADFVALPLGNRDAADPHDLIFGDDFPNGDRRTMFRGTWRPFS